MAALAATLAWEVNGTGVETNGGAYNSARAGAVLDMTYPTSAPVTITATLNCSSSTTLTDSGNNFLATMVGNTIQINNVTYEITVFGSTGSVTIHTAGPSLTNATGTVGGALLTPGRAFLSAVGGNAVNVKAGTYSITSASTNIASGCISMPAGANATSTRLIGYQTTRGDLGTPPLLQAGNAISTFSLIGMTDLCDIENIKVDGAGLTSARGITSLSGSNRVHKCIGVNCTNHAFVGSGSSSLFLKCYATTCATIAAYGNGQFVGCVADANTGPGFDGTGASVYLWCIASNNSGASSDGFNSTIGPHIGCIAYNNGRHGWLAEKTAQFINCIAANHTAIGASGIKGNSTYDFPFLQNCAAYNNTTNVNANVTAANIVGLITCSADPFTNAAGGDFSLNNTVGGGRSLRAAGFLGAFPTIGTTGKQDVGPAQHTDPASTTRQPRFRIGTGS